MKATEGHTMPAADPSPPASTGPSLSKPLAPQARAAAIECDAHDLLCATGLLRLAIGGGNAVLQDSVPGEWYGESMEWGGRLVHSLAERLAARTEGRETRWMVPAGDAFYGESGEPVTPPWFGSQRAVAEE